MNDFNFKLTHEADKSKARRGTLDTPHGKIETPVFMAVGTKGSVKTLSQEDLEELNAQIILNNTYHLFLRPGHEAVKALGKVHKFIKWNKPILTDSGGFQVFSLGQENKSYHSKNNPQKIGVKINDNGVEFQSYLDGSKHYFTPERAIQVQHDLGGDIIMAFDECAPAESSEKYFKEAMERTHNWLTRCKKEHLKLLEENKEKRALFGIVQGGISKTLRAESAKFVNSLDLPGNAIGGLSVGESKEDMHTMIEACIPHLDKNKPRYLMGVGTPEDILESVDRGIDMFDCVHPTRMARHGAFFTKDGRKNIKNSQFKLDDSELYKGYSKAYIRHLFVEKEILALKILTMNNLHFLLELMRDIRKTIEENRFKEFKETFLKRYLNK
jgi:queuine tRNA-ribosyltransferase